MPIEPKMISKCVTATGTKVEKCLEEPMKAGFGRLFKKIEYPAGSPLAKLGIDTVVIRNAGKQGKHIMAFGADKCRFVGVTNPASEIVRPVTQQFREYINTIKTLSRFGINANLLK